MSFKHCITSTRVHVPVLTTQCGFNCVHQIYDRCIFLTQQHTQLTEGEWGEVKRFMLHPVRHVWARPPCWTKRKSPFSNLCPLTQCDKIYTERGDMSHACGHTHSVDSEHCFLNSAHLFCSCRSCWAQQTGSLHVSPGSQSRMLTVSSTDLFAQ